MTELDMIELKKLARELVKRGISYEMKPLFDGWQIIVTDKGGYLWDAICHSGSDGHEYGLIEVMGEALLGHDDVKGWLTADDVITMLEGKKS